MTILLILYRKGPTFLESKYFEKTALFYVLNYTIVNVIIKNVLSIFIKNFGLWTECFSLVNAHLKYVGKNISLQN